MFLLHRACRVGVQFAFYSSFFSLEPVPAFNFSFVRQDVRILTLVDGLSS